MEISWIGNTSFLIKTDLGKRILTDPINKFHSCNIDNFTPNIITLSSLNFKCNCFKNISNNIKIINTTEKFISDIGNIYGIKTYCDKFNGAKRGENIIYILEIDNLKLVHLGYLGEQIDDSILNKIKFCDILFIPVGGNINLNGIEAFDVIEKISPKISIPMNYKINKESIIFNSIEEFLMCQKKYSVKQMSILKINNKEINEYKNTIIKLNII